MGVRTLVLFTLILLFPLAGSAQTSTLGIGSRVRYTVPPPQQQTIIGTVSGQRGDSLLVATSEQDTVPVPRSGKLEASAGIHGHAGSGAVIGFLGGVALGVGLGAVFGDAHVVSNGVVVAGAGVLGGLVGMGLGAAIGSGIQTERWQPVPAGHLNVLIEPRRGTSVGLRVGVRLGL